MKSRISCAILAGVVGLGACSGNETQNNVVDLLNDSTQVEPPTVAPAPDVAPQPVKLTLGEAVLNSPSDFQMAVAFYQIVGLSPPFDEWARSDPRVRSANEFDRPAVLARVQEELRLAAGAVSGIGYIALNANSQFGEYDMTSQGFRLEALSNDRFYSWNYEGKRYRLTMENGTEASLWKIPVEEARRLVEGGGYRSVDLTLRIKIIGALPESGGGTLQGRIVGYQIFSRDSGGRKLGEMAF